MATITAVTVTITTPAGQVITLNTTDAGEAAAGVASAVDALTVSWGQPTPLDHQQPGRLAFTVLTAVPDPVPWESEVVITASVDGRPAVPIGHGWVDATSWRRGPRGLWLTTVTLADVLARAAASKMPAAATWPVQLAADRRAAITSAIGWDPFDTTPNPVWADGAASITKVSPSDTALDLAARLHFGSYALLIEGTAGIRARMIRCTALIWPADSGGVQQDAYLFPYGPPAEVAVPAGAIEDTARQRDRTAALTRIRYGYLTAAGDKAEEVIPNPAPVPGSTAEIAVTADQAGVGAASRRYLQATMAGLRGAALVALEPGRIRLDLLPAATVEQLIQIPARSGLRVTITDCPADLDPWQTLTAATLTVAGVNGECKATLTATLRPSAFCGDQPLRWSDCPTPTDPAAGYDPATFGRMGAITAAQCGRISTPRSDRYA